MGSTGDTLIHMTLAIDSTRLVAELQELALFSEPAAEGAVRSGSDDTAVTRIVFTDRDREARQWLTSKAQTAGLAIRTDSVGNTFFRWQGSQPQLPAVATGSHIDAIPSAGMYDGTVGVLGGLEAIRALQASGFQPVRSIELILFTSEEPTRFGIGCLGSRIISGAMTPAMAAPLRDSQARTLDQVRHAAGYTGSLQSAILPRGHYAHFVELHIEQGPLLEQERLAIGAVTAIAAPASSRISIEGFGGHAGALLMPWRRDALCAASEIILAVEAAALATNSIDTVATVGLCEVFPGAVNSVPSRVRLALDVRDIEQARRDRVLQEIDETCHRVAARRNVTITHEILNADAPCTCSPQVLAAIDAACAEDGIVPKHMVSRAYHDTLFMARLCPVSMIFIPCRAGVSHRPDEYSSPEAIATGTRILASTLACLSSL
jgi:ureidoglycolate amidohydrolase